ncbi:hypothetical protein HYX12_04530 [Candidatus Woesearchaeota archaeon]|nr:hypothetical protein [Candidatus Woesearchaeota archaeon]
MRKFKTFSEAYDSCLAEGYLRTKENVDIDKINSLLKNAEIYLNSAQILINNINQKALEWMNVYTLNYEALRILTEALLRINRLESTNHQCLFAALCCKYQELELDWEIMETIRIKRHGINYYGESITYSDWKSIELQINLYISAIKKEIMIQLNEIQP